MFLFLSLLDLAGIGLILPYVALLASPESFLENNKFLENMNINLQNKDNYLIIIGLLLIALFLVKTFFAIYINRYILKVCYDRGAQLRSLLMRNYQSLPYSKFVHGNSASYIYSIQNLTMAYSKGTLQSFLRLISDCIVSFAILLLLLFTDANTLAILVLIFMVNYLVYNFFFKAKIGLLGKLTNKYSTEIIKFINEAIDGLKEIRVFGKEYFFYKKVELLSQKYADISVKNHVIQTIPRYAIEVILVVFIVSIVMIAIINNRDINSLIPILSMFGIAAMRLTPSINQIIASINQMRYGRDALRLLFNDVRGFEGAINIDDLRNSDELPLDNVFNKIELKNISYSYDLNEEMLIENLSMTISKGDFIGIKGSSGTGKSTIIDIILGLLQPTKGVILFNGLPLDNRIKDFQTQVAYIPQEVFIIDDTLKNNIALGQNEDQINYEELNKAISLARISEMVKKMPSGIDTRLGERGIMLSGGQRQRVALARSFYFDKELIIMDESTSALDEVTELEIINEIEQFKGSKTIIIISHRANALKSCDFIYDLNHKRDNEK